MTNTTELYDARMRNHPMADMKEGERRVLSLYDNYRKVDGVTIQSYRTLLSQMAGWLGMTFRTKVDKSTSPDYPGGTFTVLRVPDRMAQHDPRNRAYVPPDVRPMVSLGVAPEYAEFIAERDAAETAALEQEVTHEGNLTLAPEGDGVDTHDVGNADDTNGTTEEVGS